MQVTLPCLSVMQPWAWLLTTHELTDAERKDVENRSWPTKIRGKLLIHAGQKFDTEGYMWLRHNLPQVADLVKKHFNLRIVHSMPGRAAQFVIDRSQFSGIVGMVTLNDVVTNSSSRWAAPGQYHWLVSNGRELPLIPMPGQLRIWYPTVDIPAEYTA